MRVHRPAIVHTRNLAALRERLRLVLVGDGPLRALAQSVLVEGGVADLARLPGERTDVPAVMRGLNAFGNWPLPRFFGSRSAFYRFATNSSADTSAWRRRPARVPTFNSVCSGTTQPLLPRRSTT